MLKHFSFLNSRSSQREEIIIKDGGEVPPEHLQPTSTIEAVLKQVYGGNIGSPYEEVYHCFREDPDQVLLIINQFLHQQDDLYVYDRLMICLVEHLLENFEEFANLVIQYKCMWSILVERWQLVKHDAEQWKQNAFRLKNCIEAAELKHKRNNAETAGERQSILTIDLGELQSLLNEIYVERKEAIPREKIGVIENCKILRERQKDAIKNYLEDEIIKMMGNLLFVYEKKLTLDTEQWMMTYQNSETLKLMAEMNDWFVKTCGTIVERNLAMDLLESDFNGEFDAFIQPIVDASSILPDVPDNLINLKKSHLEVIREQFKQKQSEKIEKLEHDLSGWVQINEDRFIRDHSSLEDSISNFQEEVLQFIRRRYPNVDMLDLAPAPISKCVQDHENRIWNRYQKYVNGLKKQFREWFNAEKHRFLDDETVRWEQFDAEVKAWYADVSDGLHSPEEFSAFVDSQREGLQTAFYDKNEDLINGLRETYLKWVEQNQDQLIRFYFDENVLQDVFAQQSEDFITSQKAFAKIPLPLISMVQHQTQNIFERFRQTKQDATFSELLEEMRLDSFVEVFEEKGFDDATQFEEIDECTLLSLGMAQGHLRKWHKFYPNRRPARMRVCSSPALFAMTSPPQTPTFRLDKGG